VSPDVFEYRGRWLCPACEQVTRCPYRCSNDGCGKDLAGRSLDRPDDVATDESADVEDDQPEPSVTIQEIGELEDDGRPAEDECPDCGGDDLQREAVAGKVAWWCPHCGEFVRRGELGESREVVA
jgi:predicted RNA-binding Zn-ribbon protein involved in translation (DUF1610 family)